VVSGSRRRVQVVTRPCASHLREPVLKTRLANVVVDSARIQSVNTPAASPDVTEYPDTRQLSVYAQTVDQFGRQLFDDRTLEKP
jgi:hypothetical protein